jgi:hypothetical protein
MEGMKTGQALAGAVLTMRGFTIDEPPAAAALTDLRVAWLRSARGLETLAVTFGAFFLTKEWKEALSGTMHDVNLPELDNNESTNGRNH